MGTGRTRLDQHRSNSSTDWGKLQYLFHPPFDLGGCRGWGRRSINPIPIPNNNAHFSAFQFLLGCHEIGSLLRENIGNTDSTTARKSVIAILIGRLFCQQLCCGRPIRSPLMYQSYSFVAALYVTSLSIGLSPFSSHATGYDSSMMFNCFISYIIYQL